MLWLGNNLYYRTNSYVIAALFGSYFHARDGMVNDNLHLYVIPHLPLPTRRYLSVDGILFDTNQMAFLEAKYICKTR